MDNNRYIDKLTSLFVQHFELVNERKPNEALINRIQGFIQAGEVMSVISRVQSTTIMEKAHIEVFGESINDRKSKKAAFNAAVKSKDESYFDKHTTFYCDCDYMFDDVEDRDGDGNTHETMIHPESCGYIPRNPITKKGKENARVSRIEWEHIVPAHVIGGHLDEWKNKRNYPQCQKSNGKFIGGRDCAYKLNENFKRAHDDMNNITPAVGELNGDRSNFSFAVIQGEPRAYGQCDFEIDFDKDVAEPPDSVKGNIARTYFHMIKEYGAQISTEELTQYLFWDRLDPVDEWECLRNNRIEKSQGLGNSFVYNAC